VAGLLILLLVALTTAGGYVVGVRTLGLRRASLPAALGKSLECIGVALMFMIANTALGFALVLALRAVGRTFVSLYLVSDPSVAILSLLQAIAFLAWLDSRERAQSSLAKSDDVAKIEDPRPQ
jgi:hypothetical protein